MVSGKAEKLNKRHPRIRRGDTVRVVTGKDKGKKAKVMAVLPKEDKVLVEGVNMVKKHVRPKRSGEKGQRVSVAAPVHISNVQLVCPSCKKSSRVGVKRQDRRRQRVCKKCQAVID